MGYFISSTEVGRKQSIHDEQKCTSETAGATAVLRGRYNCGHEELKIGVVVKEEVRATLVHDRRETDTRFIGRDAEQRNDALNVVEGAGELTGCCGARRIN